MKLIQSFKKFNENAIASTSNNVDTEYALKVFPIINTIPKYFKYGNSSGFIKPITDREKKEDKELLNKVLVTYNKTFGTDYTTNDLYDIIIDPTIQTIYSGDLVRQLCINSFKTNIYNNIDLRSNDSIYSYLLDLYIYNSIKKDSDELKQKFKSYLFKKIPNFRSKKSYLYNFLKQHGNEFDLDVVKDVNKIKSKYNYEMGGEGKSKMPQKIQIIFLKALKTSLDKFNDLIDINKLFDKIIIYLKGDMINNDFKDVVDKYIANKLNKWLSEIR